MDAATFADVFLPRGVLHHSTALAAAAGATWGAWMVQLPMCCARFVTVLCLHGTALLRSRATAMVYLACILFGFHTRMQLRQLGAARSFCVCSFGFNAGLVKCAGQPILQCRGSKEGRTPSDCISGMLGSVLACSGLLHVSGRCVCCCGSSGRSIGSWFCQFA